MMLRDRLTRDSDGKEYRCAVYSRTTAAALQQGIGGGLGGEPLYFEVLERLRAMVQAGNYTQWATNETVRWRGRQYDVTGVEVIRRHGRDHHYLLNLELA